jgi:DAK2 domain fusion protein YloV
VATIVSDLERAREIAATALAALERNRRRIDDLNVYPVPDGDTGTNMTLTARAVVDDLERSSASDRPAIAHDVTRAALLGARGNSGVILSQIVRGAAELLAHNPAIDAAVVARASRAASDAAYKAVRKPVEGTMLSVIRELAEEAEARAAVTVDLDVLLKQLVRRAEEAVARTPEQLDVLRHAGVVDAGGAGLLELVRGIAAAVAHEQLPSAPVETAALTYEAIHLELSRYRYCTTFLIEGDGLDQAALEAELERMGDSLLVVGDPAALKVHVHTDDPGAALALGTRVGVIDRVEIANMHQQTAEREERLEVAAEHEVAPAAVVAVVAGDGNRRLFESLGAIGIVEGGQTMNPSTADLLTAIERAPGETVVLLPNNSNVILAAEQAATNAEKPTRVVPTDSLPAGLAAMVAFDATRDADDNAAEMVDVLSTVVTGEVTVASRDVELNGIAIHAGAYLGLAGGEAVAGGADFGEVASEVVERLLAEPRGVLTLLTGEDEPDLEPLLRRLQETHPEVEVDVQQGGQPHYPLLVGAE